MSEPNWHLPIIYDANTPVWRPPFDRALRAAIVMGIEWSSLSLIEDSPRYVKIATLIIAVLILAVLESRYFLMLKGRWYFPSFIASLLVIYGSVIVYAFNAYPSLHRESWEAAHTAVIHDPTSEIAKATTSTPHAAEISRENPLANLQLAVYGFASTGGIRLDVKFLTDAEPLTIFIDYRRGDIVSAGLVSPVRIHRGELTRIANGSERELKIAYQANSSEIKWVSNIDKERETGLNDQLYRIIVTLIDPTGRKQIESFAIIRMADSSTGGQYTYIRGETFSFIKDWRKEDISAETWKP